jgi:hypothetical protein
MSTSKITIVYCPIHTSTVSLQAISLTESGFPYVFHELHYFGGSYFLIRSDAKLKNSFKADSGLSGM